MALSRSIVRDEKIIVKLSAEKKGQLQDISEKMGVSMSAIGAYIIGQWLMQQELVTKPLIDRMGNQMADILADQMAKAIATNQGQD